MIPLRDTQPSYSHARSSPSCSSSSTCSCSCIEVSLDRFSTQPLHRASTASIPDRLRALSLVTSMFLHGGWMHLIGNMWFLWIFGDNVEDILGHGKYLLFYLLCGVAAALAQVALNPDSRVPMVGASGAIAGVMGAYLVKFPHARILTLVSIFFFFTTVEVPARVHAALLVRHPVLQRRGLDRRTRTCPQGGVAWFAHVGGFVAGMLLILLMRRARPLPPGGATCTGRPAMIRTGRAGHRRPSRRRRTDLRRHADPQAEMGYRTGVLDLTAGDMGTRGTPEMRIAEAGSGGAPHAAGLARQPAHARRAPGEHARRAHDAGRRRSARLRPRVVILPYWEARHPDHYRAGEMGYEACFLAGLRKLDPTRPPHRPFKILYSSLYANVTPSFVVDISAQFERRMAGAADLRVAVRRAARRRRRCFPAKPEIRERLAAVARFYGNLIGVRYGEPFVVKETMRVDDVVAMGVRSL